MSITKNEEGRDSVAASPRTSESQRTGSLSSTTSNSAEIGSPRNPKNRPIPKLVRRFSFGESGDNDFVLDYKSIGFLMSAMAIGYFITNNSKDDTNLLRIFTLAEGAASSRLPTTPTLWIIGYFSTYLFILYRGRSSSSISAKKVYNTVKQFFLFSPGGDSSPENSTTLKPSATSTQSLSQRLRKISSKQCWGNLQASLNFERAEADAGHHHVCSLSATEPFVPTEIIADMTLIDLTLAFRYALNFQSEKLSRSSENTVQQQVFASMDSAVCMSRGADVEPARPSASAGHEDVDALRLCAAIRLLAEWRLLRQVPDGCKGYAVGVNLGKRDLIQNIGKMEHVVHSYIDYQKQLPNPPPVITSPTVRQLMQYEIDTQAHARLPKLKDKTAAIGLLWNLRQMQYQNILTSNLIQIPDVYKTAKDAAAAAYQTTYGKYHGWAIRKVFNYSFQGAPDVGLIYEQMNPRRLQELVNQAEMQESEHVNNQVNEQQREPTPPHAIGFSDEIGGDDISIVSSTETDTEWLFIEDNDIEDSKDENAPGVTDASFLSELSFMSEPSGKSVPSKEDKKRNPLEQFGQHIATEWDKFGKHVEGEWNKIAGGVVRIFDQKNGLKKNKLSSRRNLHPSQDRMLSRRNLLPSQGDKLHQGELPANQATAMTDVEFEEFISKHMLEDAKHHITVNLEVTKPMVQDLMTMMEELNMNDPTRV